MVAYALKETSTEAFMDYHLVLFLAVLFWGLSFYFGCKNISYINSSLYTNLAIIHAQNGQIRELRNENPAVISAACDGMRDAFESNSNKANFYGRLQFSFIIIGSIIYIIWHILKMVYIN
jgi:hypothetical protein